MEHAEFMNLEPAEAAKILNERVAAGKTHEEAEAEFGLTKDDLRWLNVFWVKDKYMARVWGGYNSVKPSGNEKGDSFNGIGQADPSKGFTAL